MGESSQLQENGFSILREALPQRHIEEVYQTIVSLVAKYHPSIAHAEVEMLRKEAPWISDSFNQMLLSLRQESPEMYGMIYDSVQMSLSLLALSTAESLVQCIAREWNCRPDVISVSGHMLRMDPPHDRRNALNWHQDSSYYDQNLRGENGLVVWVPMHSVASDNGSLIICPKSHKEGKLDFEFTSAKDQITSEQRVIPPELVLRYSPVQVEANGGDVLIMNMDTFHKSGENNSPKLRFVAGYRLHRMDSDDYLSGKLHFVGNTRIGRM